MGDSYKSNCPKNKEGVLAKVYFFIKLIILLGNDIKINGFCFVAIYLQDLKSKLARGQLN